MKREGYKWRGAWRGKELEGMGCQGILRWLLLVEDRCGDDDGDTQRQRDIM